MCCSVMFAGLERPNSGDLRGKVQSVCNWRGGRGKKKEMEAAKKEEMKESLKKKKGT